MLGFITGAYRAVASLFQTTPPTGTPAISVTPFVSATSTASSSFSFEQNDMSFHYLKRGNELCWSNGEDNLTEDEINTLAINLNQAYSELERTNHPFLFADDGQAVVQRAMTNAFSSDAEIYSFLACVAKKYETNRVVGVQPLWFQSGKFSAVGNKVMKNLSSASNIHGQKCRAADIMFIPFNSHAHWYLVAIYKEDDTKFSLYAVDGLNHVSEHPTLFATATSFLLALYPDAALEISEKSLEIPVQNNFVDCGYILCILAELLAKGREAVKLMESFQKDSSIRCDYTSARAHVMQGLLDYITSENIQKPTASPSAQSSKDDDIVAPPKLLVRRTLPKRAAREKAQEAIFKDSLKYKDEMRAAKRARRK